MRILGMVTHTHDTGVALLNDGEIEVVVEEERLNREKKTQLFPAGALDAALHERGLTIDDVDVITMPWNIPRFWWTFTKALLRKFPRSTNLVHARSHPVQQNQLFRGSGYLASRLREHLGRSELPPIVGVGHHDSHAAGYFVSPFEDATVLVMDGYGDDASTSLYLGEGARLERRWHTSMFNSLGIVYTVVTGHLGFTPNRDEGKVMGLAAYGSDRLVEAFRDLVHLEPEGRYRVDMRYFQFDCYGLDRPTTPLFREKFGPPRRPDEELTDHHRDLAFALQAVIEETILHVARHLASAHPSRNLCLSGGVALNCVANAKILEETDFERIWIPPNPSDAGVPLGSALWHHHVTNRKPRHFVLTHPYYGKEYSQDECRAALADFGMDFEDLPEDDLLRRVAADLADGKIVGWFQGRFEMGPRALGNRSILADPRRAEMKDIINRRVKHREPFRPFAPAVLLERASEWFELEQEDPFMTIAPKVRKEKVPLIPAGVHEDQTGRIQTVDRRTNPRYHGVIRAFEELTGVPVLLNTSFNRQEPIVSTPAEAISCFLRTDMDVLVLGDSYSTDRNEASIALAEKRFADGREQPGCPAAM
ncbi:MAG: carbamoyltransferase C-terminal domain-containing protein [Verrucomicrobiales bacterium]